MPFVTQSHAAELAAGYYDTRFRDGYLLLQHQSSSETHGQPNLLLAKGKRKLDKYITVPAVHSSTTVTVIRTLHNQPTAKLAKRRISYLKKKWTVLIQVVENNCNQLTQRRGSSKNLMALLTNDGFVAKACHVHSVDVGGKLIIGHPDYGPMPIGKAQTGT
ncbi:P-loop NTPase domain-containing protein LPA1 homolog 2-like protein isoform X1 [Tanacetum coccineum]